MNAANGLLPLLLRLSSLSSSLSHSSHPRAEGAQHFKDGAHWGRQQLVRGRNFSCCMDPPGLLSPESYCHPGWGVTQEGAPRRARMSCRKELSHSPRPVTLEGKRSKARSEASGIHSVSLRPKKKEASDQGDLDALNPCPRDHSPERQSTARMSRRMKPPLLPMVIVHRIYKEGTQRVVMHQQRTISETDRRKAWSLQET